MSQPVPVFHGVVTADGTLKLDARDLFLRYVRKFRNQAVMLVVKKRARPKSQNQLGYLWGVLYHVIAEGLGYQGYEVEALHDAIMRELRGLKEEPNPLKLRQSLAEMTHEETSAYIEEVRYWALDKFGIVTPDAEQAIPAKDAA